MKAVWKGKTIAQSNDTVVVEGNHYFPAESLNRNWVLDSKTTSVCSWKGTAHYYSINLEGDINADAIWYYPEPKSAAAEIKGRVAFWKGVKVVE